MRWRRTASLAVLNLALVGLLALVLAPNELAAQRLDPAAVVDAYQAARARGDVDALAALFSDDAVVTDPFGSAHSGKAEVRQWLATVAARPRTVGVERASVSTDRASWFEQVGTGTGSPGFAVTAEAVLAGGRIASLVYRRAEPTQEPAQPADTRTPFPAPLGLAAVLLVLALAVAASRALHPPEVSSREGMLLADLQKWAEHRRRS
jgi:ketosteroid isomerase-like protein